MSTCREQEASTTVSSGRDNKTLEITPVYCCSLYFSTVIFIFLVPIVLEGLHNLGRGKTTCYAELFAHSVSVSNATNAANVTTADWRTVFIAKSPVTRCKLSLHTVTSRLLRGDEVISQVFDDFGRLVTFEKTDELVSNVDFKNVLMTPPVVNGSVVWGYRVESVVRLNAESALGYLAVVCSDIPVKFTADAAGNVVGSLFGVMRPCEYSLRDNLKSV